MLMVENVLLGRSALCGSGVYWEAELTMIDGEINSVCTRSYKGLWSTKHIAPWNWRGGSR